MDDGCFLFPAMTDSFDRAVRSIRTSFFVESPMYYDAKFNSEMHIEDHNKEMFSQIKKEHSPFAKFLEWDVYKIPDKFLGDVVTFCLVQNGIIDAFMEIASNRGNNFSRGVWQRNISKNKGLIRKFITDFLPKYYKTLISDKTANKLGISFYKKLLDDCSNKGMKVTVLKGSLDNEVSYNPVDFYKYWHNVAKDIATHPTFVTFKDDLFKIYFHEL